MNDQAAREEEFFAHCDCCLKDCYPIKADFGGYFCGHCYKFALHYHKENASLRAENERLRSRLTAAEAVIKIQGEGDFPPRVYFGQANNGTWFVEHDDEDGNRVALMRDETCPMYWGDWYDAYLAAVAAGWLTAAKETPQLKQGET